MKFFMSPLSRKWLVFFFTFATVFILSLDLKAQDELQVFKTGNSNSPEWKYYKDAQHFMYDHLSGLAFDLLDARTRKVNKIQSPGSWEQRQEEIRKTLMKIMGPFPEKTDLNAKTLKTIKKEGYKVEHIVFESQPGYRVTSSLYIPSGLKRKKAPAIIFCSGHSALGYRSERYQFMILNLVKKGFVVFAFDPIGQGERIQYYDSTTGKSKIGAPTKEHSYPGAQAFLTGGSLAGYMAWDGIRAIDYLVTRKEVDASRIGITGRSGGGTQSAYIAALDDRIYAAAPECYLTNFERLFQSIGPQDAEQNLLRGIHHGIDHPDFLIVRAPKPALMITTTNDFFSIQGARETEEEVSRIYSAFGKPENFGRSEDTGRHESTKKNREAMYAFFRKHLGNPGIAHDEEVDFLTESELRVTATGQLATSLGSETVFSLNKKQTEKYKEKTVSSGMDPDTHLSGVLESARNLSGYREPGETDKPVFTGNSQKDGYVIEKYFVQGEGDYVIPYLMYIPDVFTGKVLLYIHPKGKTADPEGQEETQWFVKQGFAVISPDLLGTGETYPEDYRGDAYIDNVSLNLWFAAILVNKSIAGIRAGDVNRLARIMEDRFGGSDIYALAREEMGPVLLHAAAFNKAIKNIALIQPYASYHAIAINRFYDTNFIYNAVPGAIRSYDLPDLGACLAPRKLLIVNPTDGAGKALSAAALDKELSVIKVAFKLKGAEEKLKIMEGVSENALRTIYANWGNN